MIRSWMAPICDGEGTRTAPSSTRRATASAAPPPPPRRSRSAGATELRLTPHWIAVAVGSGAGPFRLRQAKRLGRPRRMLPAPSRPPGDAARGAGPLPSRGGKGRRDSHSPRGRPRLRPGPFAFSRPTCPTLRRSRIPATKSPSPSSIHRHAARRTTRQAGLSGTTVRDTWASDRGASRRYPCRMDALDAMGAMAGIWAGLRRWLDRRTTPSDDPWAGLGKVATGLLLVPSAVSHLIRSADKWWLHVLPARRRADDRGGDRRGRVPALAPRRAPRLRGDQLGAPGGHRCVGRVPGLGADLDNPDLTRRGGPGITDRRPPASAHRQ